MTSISLLSDSGGVTYRLGEGMIGGGWFALLLNPLALRLQFDAEEGRKLLSFPFRLSWLLLTALVCVRLERFCLEGEGGKYLDVLRVMEGDELLGG